MPKLLSDDEAVYIIDEILNNNDWEYISPRGKPEMYFGDLKQLVSVMNVNEFRKKIYSHILKRILKILKRTKKIFLHAEKIKVN